MITTRITLDVSGAIKTMTALQQQQLPFARSLAVNKLGEAFQQAERARLGQIFTLRRKSFVELQGVKRLGGIATKASPTVTYGIDPKASFLEKFEDQRVKRPTLGAGHSLAVPVQARRSRADIITTANRPKALIAKGKTRKGAGRVFVLTAKRGPLGPGVFQTTGRKGRGAVKLLFAFESQVRIDPTLSFVETAKKIADERWPSIFDDAMAQALRTAR